MSPSPVVTAVLIITVAVVSFVLLLAYPAPEDGEEGRVLAFVRIEGAQAGFTNTTTFQVQEDYQRIGLSYVITEAAHVRVSIMDPEGLNHTAQAIRDRDGDRLELDVHRPPQGTWGLTIWTLDEDQRPGYIDAGEFFILGFGPQNPSG